MLRVDIQRISRFVKQRSSEMKGILVFKNVRDARAEGFEIYDYPQGDYIVVSKATPNGRAFAVALRETPLVTIA